MNKELKNNYPRVRRKRRSADFQSAVSQNCIPRAAGTRRTIGNFQRTADCKSAIRQRATLRKTLRAFSLIELIGVLAVIAILATALVPALIRQMDRIAGEQESAALKSLSDALQSSIMRLTPAHPTSRYIPSDTDWASTVATELGVDIA